MPISLEISQTKKIKPSIPTPINLLFITTLLIAMDAAADKDKPLPQESSPPSNNDIIISNKESHLEKPKLHQDNNSPKNHEIIITPSPHAPLPADDDDAHDQSNHEIAVAVVESKEIKDLEEEHPAADDNDDQKNIKEEEEEVEESAPLPLDLDKLSEEIDQYILTILSTTSSEGNDCINSTDHESTPPPDIPHFVQQFSVVVEAKIGDYDSSENPVKWSRLTEEDSSSFLESINRLYSLSNALSQIFSSENKYADSINRIGGVLQRAMSYVEEEFKSLLQDYKINDVSSSSDPTNGNETKPHKQSPSSTSTNQQSSEQNPTTEYSDPLPDDQENFFPRYSDEILSDLIRLSKAMISGGHETECCQVYFVGRRNALEQSLQKLGFEKYSIDEVHKMQWESLEREIVTWITTFKQCAAVHFPSEKKLSESVFSDHPSISETLFCSLSQSITIQLLNFAGAVALTKRAAEKLFKFLDMYEALRYTLVTTENLFPEDLMNDIKTEASMIKGRLGEAMISILVELENSIKSDSVKSPVPGGAVHPLTRYTMNYLKYACEYKETLEQVFREHQKIERADSATGSDFNYYNMNSQAQQQNHVNDAAVKQSPFQTQMIKVMDLVDANLEGKSKLYKDHALSSIFMMNNGRYILQKVRGSNEIISLMGDSWCRHRSSDLRQYHKGYQRETWGKLLNCLHPDGLTVNGKVVKPVLKERFKSFNAMFDEIHKTQSNWVVSDEQLQSELRVSISNMVIPAYRSFLGRFSLVFTPGRQTEKYVKYQAEDIETYIDELFDGNAAAAPPAYGRKKT